VREITFFRLGSGRSPVEDFLDSLPSKDAQKVAWVLRLVEELDIVPAQYLKQLTNTQDIWEVRAQHGGNAYRLLGFFDGPNLVVMAVGFSKKSSKVPKKEIELAEERRKEYFKRRK
jgi:phage-related protein